MPTVFVLTGADVGRSFRVGHGATFGRNPDCTVTLRDRSVSRRHAHLDCDELGTWWLVDAGSRNGVFAGGERVERVELADGAEVGLGELLLRVRLGEDVPDAAADADEHADEHADADADEDEIRLEGADEIALGDPQPAPGPRRAEASPLTATAIARPGARPAPEAVAGRGATGRVLQYHRHDDTGGGLLSADLSQLPAWKRGALVLLALAAAGALFYGAWWTTTYLRSQGGAAPDAEESP